MGRDEMQPAAGAVRSPACLALALKLKFDHRSTAFFHSLPSLPALLPSLPAPCPPAAEELESLLGPRPYRSNELRNIDKFRDGFNKTPLVDTMAAVSAAACCAGAGWPCGALALCSAPCTSSASGSLAMRAAAPGDLPLQPHAVLHSHTMLRVGPAPAAG